MSTRNRTPTNLERLDPEDRDAVRRRMQASLAPGMGVGEGLILAARSLVSHHSRASDDAARSRIPEPHPSQLERIGDTLYGTDLLRMAGNLRAAEEQMEPSPEEAARNLVAVLTDAETIGFSDGIEGRIQAPSVSGASDRRLHPPLFAIRSLLHLSDSVPDDTYAQSPLGQTLRQYWRGAARGSVRSSIESIEPGRSSEEDDQRIRGEVEDLNDLELEQEVARRRREISEMTAGLLEAKSATSHSPLDILLELHAFLEADQEAQERARAVVEATFRETVGAGKDPLSAHQNFEQQAVEEGNVPPDALRRISEGIVPGSPVSAVSLRRFRASRQILAEAEVREGVAEEPAPASGPETRRSAEGGRGLV